MKRSPIQRRTKLAPGQKGLKRGTKPLARTRLAQVGKRGKADRAALAKSRPLVLARAAGRCEECDEKRALEVHHVQSRARRPGWALLHDASNLAALCRRCHDHQHTGVKR